jgi:hypothetical protein
MTIKMIINDFSPPSWLPSPLAYWIMERRARRAIASLRVEADEVCSLIRLRLPQCSTRYASKRLTYFLGSLPETSSRLLRSTVRQNLVRQGSKRVHGLARNLQETINTVRRLLSDDVHHADEWQLLWNDYEQLSNRAAAVIHGSARTELHKYAKSFCALDLDLCWTSEQIKRCFSDARRWISAIDKLVSKAESVIGRLPQVRQTYEQINRAIIVGDSDANAKYIATTKVIEEIQNAVSRGELDRASNLLGRAESNLLILRLYIDREASNAAEEVAMWLKVVPLCPNILAGFKSELQSIPTQPTGDHLQLWLSLRRRIESKVWKFAKERRAVNASVLGHPALKYDLGDEKQELLLEFVKTSLQVLKDATNSASPPDSLLRLGSIQD